VEIVRNISSKTHIDLQKLDSGKRMTSSAAGVCSELKEALLPVKSAFSALKKGALFLITGQF
jgi:hypothetical protein